jgi:hypothetical protein
MYKSVGLSTDVVVVVVVDAAVDDEEEEEKEGRFETSSIDSLS